MIWYATSEESRDIPIIPTSLANQAEHGLWRKKFLRSTWLHAMWGAVIVYVSMLLSGMHLAANSNDIAHAVQLLNESRKLHESSLSLESELAGRVESPLQRDLERAQLTDLVVALNESRMALGKKSNLLPDHTRTALVEELTPIGQVLEGVKDGQILLSHVTDIKSASTRISSILSAHVESKQREFLSRQREAGTGLGLVLVVTLATLVALIQLPLRRLGEDLKSIEASIRDSELHNRIVQHATDAAHNGDSVQAALEGFLVAALGELNWACGHLLRSSDPGGWESAAFVQNPCKHDAVLEAAVRASLYNPLPDYLAIAESNRKVQQFVSSNGSNIPSRYSQSCECAVHSLLVVPIFEGTRMVALIEFAHSESENLANAILDALNTSSQILSSRVFQASQQLAIDRAQAELRDREVVLVEAEANMSLLERDLDRKRDEVQQLENRASAIEVELQSATANLSKAKSQVAESRCLAIASARRFEELFNGVPVPCITTDSKGTIYEWNQSAEDFFGIGPAELLEQNIGDVLSLVGSGLSRNEIDALLSDFQLSGSLEVTFGRSGTAKKSALISVFHIQLSSSGVSGAVWSFTDISERRVIEERLRLDEAKLRTLIESLPTGVMWVNRIGYVELANSSFETVTGLSLEGDAAEQTSAFSLKLHHNEATPVRLRDNPIFRAIRLGQVTDQQPFQLFEGGEVQYISLSAAPLFGNDNKPIGAVVAISDETLQRASELQLIEWSEEVHRKNEEITQQREQLAEANRQLELLATTDGLTGLKNHRAFQEFLERQFKIASRHQTALSVCLLDVDEFKKYNDAFGHPEGDIVLKTVAKLLSECTRDADFVARYGGEEFVVILPESNQTQAREAAERMRERIEKYEWRNRPITVSIGIATLQPSIRFHSELVALADKALYHSKRSGRNQSTHAHDLIVDAA